MDIKLHHQSNRHIVINKLFRLNCKNFVLRRNPA